MDSEDILSAETIASAKNSYEEKLKVATANKEAILMLKIKLEKQQTYLTTKIHFIAGELQAEEEAILNYQRIIRVADAVQRRKNELNE